MAKSAAKPQKTPTLKAAIEAAERLLELNLKKKELEAEQDECKELVRIFVKATGKTQLGHAMAYSKNGAAKIVCRNKAANQEERLEQLLQAVPEEYVHHKLDTKSLCTAVETDKALQKLFTKLELEVVQQTEWHIKHV